MHLTSYTDYSLRVLMYLRLQNGQRVTVSEVCDYFAISQNHMIKIVSNLSKLRLIDTTRGKGGGITLASKAEQVKIGDLVRKLEPNRELVECISKDGKPCAIICECQLTPVFNSALEKFYAELNQYTLADIVAHKTLADAQNSVAITLPYKK